MNIKKWWQNQSNTDKAVLSLSSFIGIALIFIILSGILVPDTTFLTLEANNAQINAITNEFIIKGKTEPNAKVFINNNDLNLDKIPVNTDNNGNFEYKLIVPPEITDTKVSITSKAKGKYEVVQYIDLQRPLTFLSIKPMEKIPFKSQDVHLEGKSEPNASITIISNMTLKDNINLQRYMETSLNDPIIDTVTLKTDEDGNFKYDFHVPLNSTSVYFNVTAESYGKRSTNQIQNVTREFTNFPPISSIFDVENSYSKIKIKHYSGKGFSINYPDFWERGSYKNAGKNSRLYVTYENNVECIVWYGVVGKDFGKSIKDYKNTQDAYIRTWWGGTEVFEQNINKNGVKGIRTVYRCEQNPLFSNNIRPPFYLDRTTLTKDNINVYQLQLMVNGEYYEKNNHIIEKTVGSFKIN
ncbi:hypothetical protein [Methanobacterium oryzae]|uniref:hypothetical protein n=1 Tax=Methanobacterium oryzae TaxID=69540 RepID=UPI003D1C0A79